MGIRALVTSLIAVTAVSAAPAAAQELTGSWQVTSETGRGSQTITLELVQNGSELTGEATMAMGGRRGGRGGGGGGGGAAPRILDIEDGTVDGSSFSFVFTMSFGDNSFQQSFSGTFDGDSMEGTIEGGRGGGRPFTGRRGG